MRLSNGSLVKEFIDRTEVLLTNGTLKQSFHSGCTLVRFANGDVKQSWDAGETIPCASGLEERASASISWLPLGSHPH